MKMLAKTRDELLPKPKRKDNNGYNLAFSTETSIQNTSRKISSTYRKGHLPSKSIPRETNNCIP